MVETIVEDTRMVYTARRAYVWKVVTDIWEDRALRRSAIWVIQYIKSALAGECNLQD